MWLLRTGGSVNERRTVSGFSREICSSAAAVAAEVATFLRFVLRCHSRCFARRKQNVEEEAKRGEDVRLQV